MSAGDAFLAVYGFIGVLTLVVALVERSGSR